MNSFRLVASGQIVADNDDLNEVKRKGEPFRPYTLQILLTANCMSGDGISNDMMIVDASFISAHWSTLIPVNFCLHVV